MASRTQPRKILRFASPCSFEDCAVKGAVKGAPTGDGRGTAPHSAAAANRYGRALDCEYEYQVITVRRRTCSRSRWRMRTALP